MTIARDIRLVALCLVAIVVGALAAQATGAANAATAPRSELAASTNPGEETKTGPQTRTVTAPPKTITETKTKTVTAPVQTNTVIKSTTTVEPKTTSSAATGTNGAGAEAAAASKEKKDSEDEEGGLPGWAWGLIGAAAAGLVAWAIAAHQARVRRREEMEARETGYRGGGSSTGAGSGGYAE